MYEKRNAQPDAADAASNPLKAMTAEEFAALGGSAVAFVRTMSGGELDEMIEDAEFDADELYQLVMSADGTPLLVTDSEDTVSEYFTDRNMGLVSVH